MIAWLRSSSFHGIRRDRPTADTEKRVTYQTEQLLSCYLYHIFVVNSLAIGRKSSFSTDVSNVAAAGKTALEDAKTRDGEASSGFRQRTTDMHSNVLPNTALMRKTRRE